MANVIGSSWGATPTQLGDAGGVVTWSVAGAGEGLSIFSNATGVSVNPGAFYSFNHVSVLRQAFADWSRHGNIEFMQIEDPGGAAGAVGNPDIRIFFADLPGSTLGVAYFPTFGSPASPAAGDIVLDVSDNVTSSAALFRGLALHEIGHALGLDHVPQGAQSVMTPSLELTTLQPDDIAGIREVYGPQDNARPIYTMSGGERELNILDAPTGIIVNGNAQNNLIDGTIKAETFNGGSGADTLVGRGGFDTLNGGLGNDRLDGGAQADMLRGGGGNDLLLGGAGFDALYGEGGRDTLNGGDTADRLYGGADADVLYGGGSTGTTVDGLWGGAGNDRLFGQSGFDFLSGGTGNDYLDGGSGADNLYGGADDDMLFGRQGLDRLFGDTGNDTALGGSGNDGLFGGDGNDWLYGETGNDRLDGGSGADVLGGGAGFDTLIGGSGADRLNGNFNADTFVFANGHGRDVITDFEARNPLEKIDLSEVSAITSMADLRANHMSQQGADVVISTGGGNSITLLRVSITDLDNSDFIF